MKNSDLWQQYSNFTKDLSDNIRKLAFTSAALCWLFKNNENVFPEEIRFSLGAIAVFFIFDIFQYLLGALFVKFWTESKEKEFLIKTGNIEGDYHKPTWLDLPSFYCWVLKCLSLAVSYFYLGEYIFLR